MKSRTSYSKLTPYKKDLTRFAPVWALYLIIMVMVLVQEGGYYSYDRFARNFLVEFVGATGVINLIYAGVCAVMIYGDLYNTKMCYTLHAMPQRRENWLLSHLASGMTFSIVPNIILSGVLMLNLQNYWYLALYWLLAATMQFIFYYGIATLSAYLTGNRFGMLAIYAGLNFVSLLVYVAVKTIYLPMLTGVDLVAKPFLLLCPAVWQCEDCNFFLFKAVDVFNPEWGTYDNFYQYTGLGTGWGYMGIMALVGIAAMGISVMLYRLRHLECAGDFLAFSKLNPIGCVIITLCVGMGCAYLGDALSSGYLLWLIVGVIVGYFGSLMLIERRVKVFRGKTFLGLAVLGVVLAGSILLFRFDAFNIVHWTPEADEVKSVTVSNYNPNNYGYYEDYYYGDRMSVTLTEEEEIADIIEAHEDILKWVDEDYRGGHYVVLTYQLKDGRTVVRKYTAPAFGPNYEIISKYFYQPEQIMGYGDMDWEEFKAGVQYMYVEYGELPSSAYDELMDAIKADCEAGYVTSIYKSDEVAMYLEYQVEMPDGQYIYRTMYVLQGAQNTLAILRKPEVVMGYSDWDSFLETVCNVTVDGMELPEEQWESLLTAVRADCEAGTVYTDYNKASILTVTYDITTSYYSSQTMYLQINEGSENTQAWMKENLG